MGLDTNIYRVNRKKAESTISNITGYPYIDYWSVKDDVTSILYQRKHYHLQEVLVDITDRNQCEYIELTKLKAYHLLHVMQQRYKGESSNARRRREAFTRKFKEVLHNFEWERDMMVWNWS